MNLLTGALPFALAKSLYYLNKTKQLFYLLSTATPGSCN